MSNEYTEAELLSHNVGEDEIWEIADAKITFSNGDIYEGPIKDGAKHGLGKTTFVCTRPETCIECKYAEVNYNNGVAHGPGEEVLSTHYVGQIATKFIGTWENGKKVSGVWHKDGEEYPFWPCPETFDTDEQKISYEHSYCKPGLKPVYVDLTTEGFSVPDGNSSYQFSDGSVYDGDWVNNAMHGQGKIEFINGIAYEGLWENGLPHGAGGKFGPIDGKVFECQAVYGSATGTGKITFDTGDIYEGEIRMGKEYGQGKLTKADGTINEGTFKDGIFKG
jgi:hypothetical protein|tara:strand:+ start:632 stop:1465 length:834 start_codon:yes stop_codon:yes gene_type:complete